MGLEKANISKIDEKTYCFTEAALGVNVYMYLLIGDEKALLIDTGYGFTDVPTAIKEITNLPLIVVNTHGHMDHIHGNHMYEKVYISKEDEDVFNQHTNYDVVKAVLLAVAKENHIPDEVVLSPEINMDGICNAYPSVKVDLPEEMYFELGNRKVTLIETPGHTKGSICLLDEKYKRIFVSDTACIDGVLLNFMESTDVETYCKSISRLKELADAGVFNIMYPGHQITPVDIKLLNTYQSGCKRLLKEDLPEEIRVSGAYSIDGRTRISFLTSKIRTSK